jgi:hypothetical protein
MLRTLLIFTFYFTCFSLSAQDNQSLTNAPQDSSIQTIVTVNAQPELVELVKRYKKEQEGKQISGYRIQLYSGSRKGAFDLKADFLKRMPSIPISVVYESPDFKVQVGDYRTKLEAEREMEIIWPQYKSAFVVKTLIDLPKLFVLTEEEQN